MKYKRRIVFALGMLLLFLLTACSKKAKNDTPVVVRVNDSAIHMDELMYYIYEKEAEGNQMEEQYQGFFGDSYWETKDESGVTNRELAKAAVMRLAIQNDIFYQKAVEAGYKLTALEETGLLDEARATMERLTDKQKQVMGITEERLVEIREKISLASAYEKDFRDALPVDEDTATSTIYEEDYEEYEVEYLYVPTITFRADGEAIPYSSDKKQAALQQAEDLLKRARNGSSFEDLVFEEDAKKKGEASQEVPEVSTIRFLAGDEVLGRKFEKAACALASGELADSVVEEEDGYYLIRMLDDTSRDGYQESMERAARLAREEAFLKACEEIKKQYEITIQEELWEPLEIGTLTYDKEAVWSMEDAGDASVFPE